MRPPPTWSLLVLLSACKAQISGAPSDAVAMVPADTADAVVDAAILPIDGSPIVTPDAPDAGLGPFSTAQKIDVASTAAVEDDLSLSANTLELFFAINNGSKGKDLFYTSRASTSSAWAMPVPLSINSANQSDETPRLSPDDKTMFFASARAGNGNLDIYKTTRPALGSTAWTTPVLLDATINTTNLNEKWFMPCGTDRYIMAKDSSRGDTDLVEGTIGGGPPITIPTLSSNNSETGTFVSPDCLTIYFASARVTPTRIFRAQRAAATDPWPSATQVDDFASTGGNQEDPWLSPDGRTFGFASDAAGGGNKDLYLSTR